MVVLVGCVDFNVLASCAGGDVKRW
jgi:hypothetical protein